MSLAICPEHVHAVYALGEWHKVEPGTFQIDAYEIVETNGSQEWIYHLGDQYPSGMKAYNGATWRPLGKEDIQISMSLCEIKAYKELK